MERSRWVYICWAGQLISGSIPYHWIWSLYSLSSLQQFRYTNKRYKEWSIPARVFPFSSHYVYHYSLPLKGIEDNVVKEIKTDFLWFMISVENESQKYFQFWQYLKKCAICNTCIRNAPVVMDIWIPIVLYFWNNKMYTIVLIGGSSNCSLEGIRRWYFYNSVLKGYFIKVLFLFESLFSHSIDGQVS